MTDDITPEDRASHFRSVAARLREIANEIQFNARGRNQLLALADGFERYAARFETDQIVDPSF